MIIKNKMLITVVHRWRMHRVRSEMYRVHRAVMSRAEAAYERDFARSPREYNRGEILQYVNDAIWIEVRSCRSAIVRDSIIRVLAHPQPLTQREQDEWDALDQKLAHARN